MQTPSGFVQDRTGLIVPEDSATRERQVWTRAEWKLLERVTVLLGAHKLDLAMQCRNEGCKGKPLEPMRLADGGFRLRCSCTDRVMTKAF